MTTDTFSAITNALTSVGTLATLAWTVWIASDRTREHLAIEVFTVIESVDSDHPGVKVVVHTLVVRIENQGVQPVTLAYGALKVRQNDGSTYSLYMGLLVAPRLHRRPKNPHVLKPGEVFEHPVHVYVDEMRRWWPNRSSGALWFDRPRIFVRTGRGKVFNKRIPEEAWNHLQSQESWERHRERFPHPPPDPDFDEDE